MWLIFSLILFYLVTPGSAAAHPGQPPAPHDLWEAWNLDPVLLLGLAAGGVVYLRGLRALRQRAGRGRAATARQALAFTSGWAVLAFALLSPLDALSGALFTAHMLQHILLMLVAAPLLVLGLTPALLAWSLPAGWRGPAFSLRFLPPLAAAGRFLRQPLSAWLLQALALWLWHAPALYQAALANEGLHALEHLSLLGAALLFWWALLHPQGARGFGLGWRLLYLFTTALHSGLLGALLTFSPQVWYPRQSTAAGLWGFTPLEDQHLAGALMWVPAGVVYLCGALWLFASLLISMEREEQAASELTLKEKR